jgi:uncharacterized protein (UPF0333 family)
MNGQVSVEMLIVIGLGLVIVGVYAIYGYASIDSYKRGSDDFLMKDSLEKIAQTAKFVSLQGLPAKQQINVCFPVSLSNCSITNTNGTITCFLRSGQIIQQDTSTKINGSLPNNSGCWNMGIEAMGGFVNLSVL